MEGPGRSPVGGAEDDRPHPFPSTADDEAGRGIREDDVVEEEQPRVKRHRRLRPRGAAVAGAEHVVVEDQEVVRGLPSRSRGDHPPGLLVQETHGAEAQVRIGSVDALPVGAAVAGAKDGAGKFALASDGGVGCHPALLGVHKTGRGDGDAARGGHREPGGACLRRSTGPHKGQRRAQQGAPAPRQRTTPPGALRARWARPRHQRTPPRSSSPLARDGITSKLQSERNPRPRPRPLRHPDGRRARRRRRPSVA